MSTKPCASDHLYLFIYANYFIFHVFIEWIFSVCLFTYSNQCQQNHTQRPPVFVYLCKLLVVPCVFRLNINIYLFISSNRCQQKHALLFSYIYLGIRSRTGQGVHSNVITSFFIVQDSSDWTVPIYFFTSYFNIRSVTNVATSDLLPVFTAYDPLTDGGSGGVSRFFFACSLIFLICSWWIRSASAMAVFSFSLMLRSFLNFCNFLFVR